MAQRQKQQQALENKTTETVQRRRQQRVEWACRSHAVSKLLTDEYQIEALLSKGSCAILLSGYRKKDHFPVVMKVIKTSSLSIRDKEHLETEIAIFQQLGRLKKEREALSDIGSYHVLQPIEAIRDPINQNVYLISEHLKGGDLFSRLESMKGYLMNETEVLWLLRQILSGLCFLHRMGISHRDIKLENFVFTDPPGKNCYESVLKIIDFGLCHWNKIDDNNSLSHEGVVRCLESVGTLHYVPPEIIQEKEYIPEKVDSWEVGVVAYALIAQKLPFDDWDDNNVLSKICTLPPNMRQPCWDHISLGTKQLVAQLLSKDESQRISCEEAFYKVESLLQSRGAPFGEEANKLIRNLCAKNATIESPDRIVKTSENIQKEKNKQALSAKKIKQQEKIDDAASVACQPVMQSIWTFFRRSRRSTETKLDSATRSFDLFAWKSQIRDKLRNTSPLKRRQTATTCQAEDHNSQSRSVPGSNVSKQSSSSDTSHTSSIATKETSTNKTRQQPPNTGNQPLSNMYHCTIANSSKPIYSNVVSVL